MDDAAVHAVDNLGATPALLFVVVLLVIIAIVAIRAMPMVQKHLTSKIEIERDREIRKMSEAKMRHEHDMEQAAINARMVDAQNRSTAAMSALTQQMAVMNGQLEMSKERSSQMGEQIDTVAHQVGEIHEIVVKG